MNGKLLVSVIVPVYNVEKYLDKCVKSILDQSYPYFELLLVDDGSGDSSGALCDAYEGTDPRIRVFHKENGGLSDARNYGIERAEGSYLTFIDSDDFIGKDYLKILVEMVLEYQVSLASLSRQLVFGEYADRTHTKEDRRDCVAPKEALRRMCIASGILVSAWGKLYRKDLFETARFPKGMLYEDLWTIPYIVAGCDRIACSTSEQYFYVQRKNSIIHSRVTQRHLQWFDGIEKLIRFVDEEYPDIHDAVIAMYVKYSFFYIVQQMVYDPDYAVQARKVRKRCRKRWMEGLGSSYLEKKTKLKVLLMFINVRLYRRVFFLCNKDQAEL